MAVRVILVGWLAGDTHPNERRDVGERIGQRVEPVRDDADRAGDVAEHELGGGDSEVEKEDFDENGRDGLVAIPHRRGVAGVRRCGP